MAETTLPPSAAPERPDTHTKALRINLDPRRYGTFAEVGAGQEVVRWFFRAGGAAGTIAKSMSAYDTHVSDAIYGPVERYVSRERLEAMLEHEYRLNQDRLGAVRGDTTAFFAFADTVSARNYQGTNECHGWMGVRFQVRPRDTPSQIVLHVRLLDPSNVQQQEALGIVGVNLLYGAFVLHPEPDQVTAGLTDGLGPGRIEIDLIEFSGAGFRDVDNRLMNLHLVRAGLSKAAMFGPDGRVLQPSEQLHKRPVLVERGSFRPVTRTHLDILRAAGERFAERLPDADRGQVVTIAELTIRNLAADRPPFDPRDYLERVEALGAAGLTVLVSDYFEFYRLAGYLRAFTHEPIAVAIGAPTVLELFDPKYAVGLEGGTLGALGRLFRLDLKLFVYPSRGPGESSTCTAETLPVPPDLRLLYQFVVERGLVVGLDNHRPECLPITSAEVLRRIAAGEEGWDAMVPPAVADLIRARGLFGFHPADGAGRGGPR